MGTSHVTTFVVGDIVVADVALRMFIEEPEPK
jgi:hypothetical protein